MESQYPLIIEWSEEDRQYVVTCPSFPGFSALGETQEDALAEGKLALGLFIESYQERGIPLPEPRVVERYSGQFRVRIPASLHAQASRLAELERVSLNTLIVGAIEARIGVQNFYDHMVQQLERRLVKQTAANVMARVIPAIRAWDEIVFPAPDQRAVTPGTSAVIVNNVRGGK